MKYQKTLQRRLLRACWLREYEMRDLLVKDIVCEQGRWYIVLRDQGGDPWRDILQEREQLRGYEHSIWKEDEIWLPVIVGQEQVLQELIEGRDPDEHVFAKVELPSHRSLSLYRLERQYARNLYTMFSGRTPPLDKTQILLDEYYDEINEELYDEVAVRDVARILGRAHLGLGLFAILYIGRRPPKQKKRKETSVV